MKKKRYQKPLIEEVKLRVTESVLLACKLTIASTDPNSGAGRSCAAGNPANRCSTTEGS
jgi:hypothetical protein